MPSSLFWESGTEAVDFLPFSIYGTPVICEIFEQEERETLRYQLSVTFNWHEVEQMLVDEREREARVWFAELLRVQDENKLLMRQILHIPQL